MSSSPLETSVGGDATDNNDGTHTFTFIPKIKNSGTITIAAYIPHTTATAEHYLQVFSNTDKSGTAFQDGHGANRANMLDY